MKMFYLLNYILVILKVSCDQTCRHHKKMEMFPRNPIKQEGEPVIYHYRNIFKKEKVLSNKLLLVPKVSSVIFLVTQTSQKNLKYFFPRTTT